MDRASAGSASCLFLEGLDVRMHAFPRLADTKQKMKGYAVRRTAAVQW